AKKAGKLAIRFGLVTIVDDACKGPWTVELLNRLEAGLNMVPKHDQAILADAVVKFSSGGGDTVAEWRSKVYEDTNELIDKELIVYEDGLGDLLRQERQHKKDAEGNAHKWFEYY